MLRTPDYQQTPFPRLKTLGR